MSRVKGRTDDLLIVKGHGSSRRRSRPCSSRWRGPSALRDRLERRDGKDEALVRVEAASPDDDGLRRTVERRLASELGVSVVVELVAPRTLARSEARPGG